MADTKQTAHTLLDIEDFDVWQDEHRHVTADKETYQMIRSIAVDFANSALNNRLRSHDKLVEALEAINTQLECPARNTVRGNPHGFAVIISSDVREQVKAALRAAKEGSHD